MKRTTFIMLITLLGNTIFTVQENELENTNQKAAVIKQYDTNEDLIKGLSALCGAGLFSYLFYIFGKDIFVAGNNIASRSDKWVYHHIFSKIFDLGYRAKTNGEILGYNNSDHIFIANFTLPTIMAIAAWESGKYGAKKLSPLVKAFVSSQLKNTPEDQLKINVTING